MTTFQYNAEIRTRFPAIVGGVIYAADMQNAPTPDALKAAYLAEQRATIKRIGSTPLSEFMSLSAWRRAFRQFGADPTQYRSAAESLLRRLTKKGDIPFINTLVDIGNLVSIRYGLPVAVFDTRAIQGALTVRVADGTERFTPLGTSEAEHPEAGEVIFVDEAGVVMARRWCWRQSAESAAQVDTQNAIITVEAQHKFGKEDVPAAVADLLMLLKEYAGGTFRDEVL
jgi:DNA/RNA-binding domain of Phe-tRNA-synthetase-like protein